MNKQTNKVVLPKFMVELNRIIAIEDLNALTENQKEFLKARESYLNSDQLKVYKNVLKGKAVVEDEPVNSIDEFPGVTEDRRTSRGAKRKADQAKIDAEANRVVLVESDKEIVKANVKKAEQTVEELQEGVKKAQAEAKRLGESQALKRSKNK